MGGLSSLTSGDMFFESPYLLQTWLEAHFQGIVRQLPQTLNGVNTIIIYSVMKPLKEWR